MDFRTITIKQLHEKIKTKEVDPEKLIEETINSARDNLNSNFLITLTDKWAVKQLKSLVGNEESILHCIPFISKDNISTKGILTTAGSKYLSNYIPPFDATISTLLNDSGAILIGKAALDELGMGGTGLFSYNGIIKNPFDEERIVGGSSSGSAYAVCKGIVPFSIGTDTGDSIRKPASFVGIVGYKPTYGSISRYGVIPYAPSLDHVGYFTNHVEDLIYLANATFKQDNRDFTSINNEKNYLKITNQEPKALKVAFLKDVWDLMDDGLKVEYNTLFNELTKDNHKVDFVDFRKDLLEAVPAMYMMISFAEAVSTSSNLDGINFGIRKDGETYEQLIKNTRNNAFGETVKRRFLLGSYQLKKENQELLLAKSKKVRRLVVQELEKLYEEYDILILPPSFEPAPLINEVYGTDIEERYDDTTAFMKDLLILANLNGMPSITIPFIKDKKTNLPIGININSKPFSDDLLLSTSLYLEKLIKKVFNKG
ncbi:amidase family protein [Spiroplasma turonicum]|uniref:Aspartyl/glutamyl-tRNA amidotransferase subunit A n=1 Tax=Spiroplasma turonicum TaxID=216946 RepID=A0A0K1P504_9MOLU|nr:amidase family protein [Spiroplasma turonicum]AKU79358.1 aspartyl/glutamyl-tRNA amidotransferase subunit A [Spiroplasma turonicum]ALX70379.1 aspartyl/glutamyl-tRNA amidotransferase subunit A [Spiroplasma turonicum]